MSRRSVLLRLEHTLLAPSNRALACDPAVIRQFIHMRTMHASVSMGTPFRPKRRRSLEDTAILISNSNSNGHVIEAGAA